MQTWKVRRPFVPPVKAGLLAAVDFAVLACAWPPCGDRSSAPPCRGAYGFNRFQNKLILGFCWGNASLKMKDLRFSSFPRGGNPQTKKRRDHPRAYASDNIPGGFWEIKGVEKIFFTSRLSRKTGYDRLLSWPSHLGKASSSGPGKPRFF